MSSLPLETFVELPSGEWRSRITIDERSVTVTTGPGPEADVARAERAVRDAIARAVEITRYCGDQLAEIRNEGWAREGEVVDWRDFVRRLSLRAVVVRDDGAVELTYADGDLFWGHAIVVDIEPGGRLVDAQLGH